MQSKIKICKADFPQTKKNVKSKIPQNLSYSGSKRNSSLQIHCENFIIGFTVGFRAILDKRLAFTTLEGMRMPFI